MEGTPTQLSAGETIDIPQGVVHCDGNVGLASAPRHGWQFLPPALTSLRLGALEPHVVAQLEPRPNLARAVILIAAGPGGACGSYQATSTP
jgi:hypothetical protein